MFLKMFFYIFSNVNIRDLKKKPFKKIHNYKNFIYIKKNFFNNKNLFTIITFNKNN